MARRKSTTGPDRITKRWLRNASDELAVKAGCRFDEERARHAVDWIEGYCHLYEGDWRAADDQAGGLALDATMRLFGWVRYSEDWSREVRRFRKASIWVPEEEGQVTDAGRLGALPAVWRRRAGPEGLQRGQGRQAGDDLTRTRWRWSGGLPRWQMSA
jgi:hypothetical protein